MRHLSIIVIVILTLGLSACWEQDEPVPPYVPPSDIVTLDIANSLYTHQSYVDLSRGAIASCNENSEWILAFECDADGREVLSNTANYWSIAKLGNISYDQVFQDDDSYQWMNDAPDGNPDSIATTNWQNEDVFLLAYYDGIDYELRYKFQILSVDTAGYDIKFDPPGATTSTRIRVQKFDDLNYIHFDPLTQAVVRLQPNKYEWDLLFSQYHTTLYTDDGIPTPYTVRGTLINNKQGVSVALDSAHHFLDIDLDIALNATYNTLRDAVGHEWKDVKVDEGSNSAEYSVIEGQTYLIKDTEGSYYKLRFLSYYSREGKKGFPSIEFAEIIE